MNNRALVDRLLPAAVQALEDSGIAQGGRVDRRLRSQISDFGTQVSNGSLRSAAAQFNDQGSAQSERHRLADAVNRMLTDKSLNLVQKRSKNVLFYTIIDNESDDPLLEEKVLACAVALKQAMNLFDLKPEDKKDKQTQEEPPKEEQA